MKKQIKKTIKKNKDGLPYTFIIKKDGKQTAKFNCKDYLLIAVDPKRKNKEIIYGNELLCSSESGPKKLGWLEWQKNKILCQQYNLYND